MSPPRIVVDASVAVKWIAPEVDSVLAHRILRSYRPIAPQLIYAECANIIWKKVRRGELPASDAGVAADLLAGMLVDTVSLKSLMPLATDLAIRLDHPAYDCFYAALAILEDCPFVTSDERFQRKFSSFFAQDIGSSCKLLGEMQGE